VGLNIPQGFFTYGAGATLLTTGGYWLRARIDAWRTGKQAESDHIRREDEFRAKIEDAALSASEKVISVYRAELEKAQALLTETRESNGRKDEAFLNTLNRIDTTMEKMAGTMDRESQARMANDSAIQQTLQTMDGRLRLLEDRGLRA
jgi:hypothetical protein